MHPQPLIGKERDYDSAGGRVKHTNPMLELPLIGKGYVNKKNKYYLCRIHCFMKSASTAYGR